MPSPHGAKSQSCIHRCVDIPKMVKAPKAMLPAPTNASVDCSVAWPRYVHRLGLCRGRWALLAAAVTRVGTGTQHPAAPRVGSWQVAAGWPRSRPGPGEGGVRDCPLAENYRTQFMRLQPRDDVRGRLGAKPTTSFGGCHAHSLAECAMCKGTQDATWGSTYTG